MSDETGVSDDRTRDEPIGQIVADVFGLDYEDYDPEETVPTTVLQDRAIPAVPETQTPEERNTLEAIFPMYFSRQGQQNRYRNIELEQRYIRDRQAAGLARRPGGRLAAYFSRFANPTGQTEPE